MSPDTVDVVLSVQGLHKRFGGFKALDGLDWDLRRGEILGLMGPNGSGKTTCINVISGAYRSDGGEIHFCGRPISRLAPHKRVHLGLSRTFQIPRPFHSLTVFQNVDIALANGRRNSDAQSAEILEAVDLLPLGRRVAGELNTAQLKLLDLARALATKPAVILVDELAAGMNPIELSNVALKLKRIAMSGVSLVVVEHLMSFLKQVIDRVIVMDAGKKIFQGSLADASRDQSVVSLYLGDSDQKRDG